MSDRESANVMNEKMTVLCVKSGEKPKRIEIENDLDALQRAVGGYIEAVYPYEDPVALIVNEEGKLNGLPLNRALRDEDNDIYDIVAGPFLVVGLGESNFTSLTPALMEKYKKLFHCPEAFIKETAAGWKNYLSHCGYAPRTINSAMPKGFFK